MLCDPALYSGKQRVLFTRRLSNGQVFAIQHVSIDHDMQSLHDVFLHQVDSWDVDGMLEQFRSSYKYMAGSDTSQAFIASLNDKPIFEIEVHDAMGHQTNLGGVRCQQGDFVLNIAAGFWNMTSLDIYAESLARCAEYYFEFSEVRRLVINSGTVSATLLPAVAFSSGFRQHPEAPGVFCVRAQKVKCE